MYIPLEEAKEEVLKRWNNPDLRKRVAGYLGGDVAEVFKLEPRAVLFRNIASPVIES